MKILSEFNLVNPTVEALKSLDGPATNEQIREVVICGIVLPDGELERRNSNGTGLEIDYRLAWARTVLKTLGVIRSSGRGQWELTEKGHRWQPVEPPEIRKLYHQQRAPENGKNSVMAHNVVRETAATGESAAAEEAAWRRLGLEQFAAGYSPAKAVY